MVVKHHQNRHKSIGDVLLYTVITTGNISNTDLYLRPYRSGRDYCSEFNIIAHTLWQRVSVKVKFYWAKPTHSLRVGCCTFLIHESIFITRNRHERGSLLRELSLFFFHIRDEFYALKALKNGRFA